MFADSNGIMRGKLLPADTLPKLIKEGILLPASVLVRMPLANLLLKPVLYGIPATVITPLCRCQTAFTQWMIPGAT
jgi:hypothetical protein